MEQAWTSNSTEIMDFLTRRFREWALEAYLQGRISKTRARKMGILPRGRWEDPRWKKF